MLKRVPIVQWIEPQFPKLLIRVRISVGAPWNEYLQILKDPLS